MSTIPKRQDHPGAVPFSGYYKTSVPAPDPEITSSGPGTPLGEYMRRFWQPICFSEHLKDVPHPVRILGEDLVAFRDGSGAVGVLHRNCCHRGASLEFGIIQQHGIRCPYHGLQFAPDGTLIDVPCERDGGARLRTRLAQGAYPAFERDGLVFAYMGPPERVPPFIEYDAFQKSGGTRLVPFSNVFPCNWLQTMDNIADQIHTSFLHNPPMLYGGSVPEELDWKRLALVSFAKVPVLDYVALREGTAMAFIAGRRVSEERVWIRINDLIVPNVSQHASLFEDGAQRRLFHRVHMSRWYVPVDDTHSVILGWRMFGPEIDPKGLGDEAQVGWDKMDFLRGQVGDRSYEESRRLPGDWEVIVSQRPIAIHALENPLEGDVGVYLLRKLLREAIRGKNPGAAPERMHERARAGRTSFCYTQNTVLNVRARPSEKEDQGVIKTIGRRIVDIMAEADSLGDAERVRFVHQRLAELERTAGSL
ncbi:MAG: Rieske 2Fe-2S domain-containing protein [Burkholderiales bacterium]|nr:Rieske 2Fe-2S domain-containing protein [Burkholderiales bacterium]